MQYDNSIKNKTVSFRTFEAVNENIEALAKEVAKFKWKFPWQSPIRECDSKSGLINEVLAENITIQQIRESIKEKMEAENECN